MHIYVLYFHLSYADSHCKSREFQCIEGTCISNELHCNGVIDCTDSSDEFLCRTLNQLYTHVYVCYYGNILCTCTCMNVLRTC